MTTCSHFKLVTWFIWPTAWIHWAKAIENHPPVQRGEEHWGKAEGWWCGSSNRWECQQMIRKTSWWLAASLLRSRGRQKESWERHSRHSRRGSLREWEDFRSWRSSCPLPAWEGGNRSWQGIGQTCPSSSTLRSCFSHSPSELQKPWLILKMRGVCEFHCKCVFVWTWADF